MVVDLSQRKRSYSVGGVWRFKTSSSWGARNFNCHKLGINRLTLEHSRRWWARRIISFLNLGLLLGTEIVRNLGNEKLPLVLKVIVPNLDNFFGGVSTLRWTLLSVHNIILHELIKWFVLYIFQRNVEGLHDESGILVHLRLERAFKN